MSGISEVFRARIEACFAGTADRMAAFLEDARQAGEIPADCDVPRLADLLVNCWAGAALRSRLRRSPEAPTEMLDFYIAAIRRD